MQYCSLQHQSWLLPPDTSTTECQFFFGRATPFFLEILFIAFSFPSTILDTFWSGGLIFISFCLVKLSIRFSRQEYWNGLLFPSPVDYILSELITITGPSWVALHDMTHSFTEYTSPFPWQGCDPQRRNYQKMNSLLAVIKKFIELWDFIAIKIKCCRWSSYSYRLATAFQFSVIFSCLTNILLCFIRSLSIPVHQNHLCYAVEIHFCIFVFI